MCWKKPSGSQNGKQTQWFKPSHATHFHPISYREHSCWAGHLLLIGKRGDGGVAVPVVTLAVSVHKFGGGASEGRWREEFNYQRLFSRITDPTFNLLATWSWAKISRRVTEFITQSMFPWITSSNTWTVHYYAILYRISVTGASFNWDISRKEFHQKNDNTLKSTWFQLES